MSNFLDWSVVGMSLLIGCCCVARSFQYWESVLSVELLFSGLMLMGWGVLGSLLKVMFKGSFGYRM